MAGPLAGVSHDAGVVGVRSEDVIEGDGVVVAGLLGGDRPPGDGIRLGLRIELREDHAERHRSSYLVASNASRKRSRASPCCSGALQPAPIVLTATWLTPLSSHRRARSAAPS